MTNPAGLPSIERPDSDPHLWLEDIEGEAALGWVWAQNAATLARYGGPGFERGRDALASILNRPDNIPYVTRRGGYLCNFWTDAERPRGLWRRASLEEFRKDAPAWDVLLDLDALAASEGEDWIWRGAATLPGAHDRAILRLSRGGSDAVTLREFDLNLRSFRLDGFNLPEAKSTASWLDEDTLLLSSALGDGMATRSGYARTVRLWRRGQDANQAPVIFETAYENMAVYAGADRTAPAETIWFAERRGFYETAYWIGGRHGATCKLDVPGQAELSAYRGLLIIQPRADWAVGGSQYGADAVLAIDLEAFLGGARHFEILFEGSERVALQHFLFCGDWIVLSILDNLNPRFEALKRSPQGEWVREALAGAPGIGSAYVWALDGEAAETNGELLAQTQNPLTPPELKLLSPGAAPEILKRAPEVFNAAGLRVTRHGAVSADGARIPYTQTGPANESGEAPVHMTGYGGFAASLTPVYDKAVGKLWLERGGVSVLANLRGGGEFGVAWHEAGRREGKAKAHDDFAAVASDLVRRGVTQPSRIAAAGGSNGGLLIANMLTRYPERFGALFCTIPLIDMRRYSRLLAGASWINEYGDPDKPEDWAFMQSFSAYHLAAPGLNYPPILLATTRRDDRVHPGHARKMAAKLQAMGYAAHFYEPEAGGHGYGRDNAERAAFAALGYNFLSQAIGWDNEAA